LVAWLCRILLHHMGHFHPPHGFPEKHEVLRELPFDPQRFACEWQKSLFPNSFSAAGQAIRPEQIEALEACLALLPKRYRRVITLRHQKDCTFAAIGRQLECSANAARKLWWRAMKRLQDLLDSHPAT
jgi:RNA polymerase sigma factor (sigma-70 family)